VLDLHNYGRYTTLLDEAAVACPLEEAVDGLVRLSSDHLADFWSRISHALSGQPGIIGYGLMNEPHDLAAGAWVRASRAAVEAIRREGDRTPIYVAGDRWSDAGRWTQVNPTSPWIEDPENKITYEAHCYLDHDGSGQYELTYEEELDYDPYIKGRAAKRLGPFLGWLKEWGVEGALGEFAVPCQNEPWTALLPEMMKLLDEAHVPSYWWAAGEYWGDYPLSLQPPCEQEPPRSAQLELFRS
jgi:endoglucanase